MCQVYEKDIQNKSQKGMHWQKLLKILCPISGMTQPVIPSLVKMNVSGVSVGVNGGSLPPAVPKGAFVWKYKDQSVMATWHPGTYKNNNDNFLFTNHL